PAPPAPAPPLAPAAAAPPAPPPVVPPPAPPVVAAPVVLAAPAAAPAVASPSLRAPGEPSADRVVLAPTAYTHPAGTFFVSSYDVVFLQAGYALSDSTQVSVTVTPMIGEPGEVRFSLLD